MNKPLYDFFTQDHHRVEALLEKAIEDPNNFKDEYYQEFRRGLLKHIKMEEKILFPAAQQANGGEPLPLAAQLRLDHGALTTLMVPPPTDELIAVVKHILEIHDELEEKHGGMYEACEALTESQTQNILYELSRVTEVPVHPHNTAPYALEAAKRSVARAGYDYEVIAGSLGVRD